MKNDMLFESELKVMEILWNEGDTSARDLAVKLSESAAWSKTTTYTIIRRCIEKGLVERSGTNFMCCAQITREEAQKRESEILVDKMFDGSSDLLISSLLGGIKMTSPQINTLRSMIQAFVGE